MVMELTVHFQCIMVMDMIHMNGLSLTMLSHDTHTIRVGGSISQMVGIIM